jgi:putative endonuclease
LPKLWWQLRTTPDSSTERTFPLPGVEETRNSQLMSAYSVYVVRCRDGTLYTGIAKDVMRRLSEHEGGRKGAKYLRGRGPLKLVYQQEIGGRSLASKIESRIKKMSSEEKSDAKCLSGRIDEFLAEIGRDEQDSNGLASARYRQT